jgi:hypothetical protein
VDQVKAEIILSQSHDIQSPNFCLLFATCLRCLYLCSVLLASEVCEFDDLDGFWGHRGEGHLFLRYLDFVSFSSSDP